jgi:hypothetical protein
MLIVSVALARISNSACSDTTCGSTTGSDGGVLIFPFFDSLICERCTLPKRAMMSYASLPHARIWATIRAPLKQMLKTSAFQRSYVMFSLQKMPFGFVRNFVRTHLTKIIIICDRLAFFLSFLKFVRNFVFPFLLNGNGGKPRFKKNLSGSYWFLPVYTLFIQCTNHWNVFFLKSTQFGKKTKRLSYHL